MFVKNVDICCFGNEIGARKSITSTCGLAVSKFSLDDMRSFPIAEMLEWNTKQANSRSEVFMNTGRSKYVTEGARL